MKTNFNILVATDYSNAAANASRYAIRFAAATNSTLTFLHVFEDSPGYPKELVKIEKMEESPADFETKKLEQHVESLLKSENTSNEAVRYNYVVSKGDTTAEILRNLSKGLPDFMIVGTHGAGTFRRTFLGSHTWDAIKDTTIPILAIPEEASYKNVESIVFATEYRASEIPLINFLTEFTKLFNAELTVLHITNNVFSPKFEREMFEKFRKEVQEKVNYEKLNIRLINNDNLIDGLNGFCATTKSSWLVVSHEKTMLLASMFNPVSVTKQMSFRTHVPLFAVPDGYVPKTEKGAKHIVHPKIKSEDFFANKDHGNV